MKLRYLSLFSGIEAVSVAWMPLGWDAVAFCEVEPFCCSLLKQHYPSVPNLGDIERVDEQTVESLGHIDVVVGGFPCQDLSIAGKRKGLKDEEGNSTRSGLFCEFLRVADACGARFAVVENVLGLFSSNAGRDFATVVGGMAGAEVGVPEGGWRNTGVALGPKGLVEWAVLDAQFFGLAQRRKRVFVVRDSGGWRNRPPLLFDPESLRGNPSPGRTQGQGVAPTISSRTQGGGGLGTDAECDGAVIPIQEVGKRESGTPKNGTGLGDEGDPMFTLQQSAQHGVAIGFDSKQGGDTQLGATTEKSPPLKGMARHAVACIDSELNPNQDIADPLKTVDKSGTGTLPVVVHSLKADGFDASEDGTGRGVPLVSHSILSKPHSSHADDLETYVPEKAFRFQRTDQFTEDEKVGSLAAWDFKDGRDLIAGMAVRRLTPTECERIQGFPDGYTLVVHRGKPAADGPRYKALGNSMATTVMRWIGKQIEWAINYET